MSDNLPVNRPKLLEPFQNSFTFFFRCVYKSCSESQKVGTCKEIKKIIMFMVVHVDCMYDR